MKLLGFFAIASLSSVLLRSSFASDHGAKKEEHGAKKPEAKKAEGHGEKKAEPKKAEAKKPESHKEAPKKAEAVKPAGPVEEIKQTADSAFPEKEFYTKAEVEALREVLDKKTVQLDQDIDTQKKYVESLKGQIEEHLKKVETARTEIADFMNTRDEKEEGKLKKLAKFYEAMDPEQAAPLLKDVNDDLAIKIFDRMDTKKAGSILAQLPAPRAAKLTQQFPRLKLQAERPKAELK
ncbi:MAG: hypothetical protein J0L93_03230 [Deltaproteobacteria bacterium]|nr:hypothetical protein [Deltaproteobacteria bacterium]